MPAPFRLLVLGGTAEARALAAALAPRPGLAVTTSLAGRTRAPAPVAGAVRIGGFGGAAGLADYLSRNRVDAVIDATHPFAARISANAALACRRAGAPRAALWRPEWRPVPGDRWIRAAGAAAAAARAAEFGGRILLAVGRGSLAPFAARGGARYVVRTFEPVDPDMLPGAEFVVARGPFDEDSEAAFLRARRIALVVAKNAGGRAGYGKIAAARALGLPAVLIARPPPPEAPRVATVAAALAWLDAAAGARG